MTPEEFPEDEAFRARKRPVEVDVHGPVKERVEIDTREGTVIAEPGEYVIRGVEGEIYPIGADIFEATYDAVDAGDILDYSEGMWSG